jgi:hypothetical protein
MIIKLKYRNILLIYRITTAAPARMTANNHTQSPNHAVRRLIPQPSDFWGTGFACGQFVGHLKSVGCLCIRPAGVVQFV